MILESHRSVASNTKFNWGSHNCVSFSLGILKDIYNWDPDIGVFSVFGDTEAEFISRLRTERKFLSTLVEDCGATKLATTQLARIGDLVIHGEKLREVMGICYGGGRAYFLQDHGLTSISLSRCSTAWRVSDG